jgi:hypothetical protein
MTVMSRSTKPRLEPVALRRKNWLHVGSAKSIQRGGGIAPFGGFQPVRIHPLASLILFHQLLRIGKRLARGAQENESLSAEE